MCGICGYKLLSRDIGSAVKALELFRQLLLECQVRGRHATGVAYVDDEKVYSHKRPVPAEEFLKDDIWDSSFQCFIPTEMIGHTRYSTSGDWQDNKNNQPLNNRNLALVHNGLVSMGTQDEFCAEYRVQTATQNDSEIIFRKVIEDDQSLPRSLQDVLRDLDPIYALAMLDKYGNIVLARDQVRPLWIFVIKDLDLIGFASTKDIIVRACHTCYISLDNDVIIRKMPGNSVRLLGGAATGHPVQLAVKPIQYNISRTPEELPIWGRPSLYSADLGNIGGFSIPKGGDHRLNTRESFKRYSAAAVATWEIDPNYLMLNYLFRRFELSKSQQYWACYLYGVFYHPGTVFYVMQEFPEFEKVDLGRLQRWHAANWKALRYNTDRKYEKGHFVEMFESYRDLIGSQTGTSQEEFFSGLLAQGITPQERFRVVDKALRKLLRFGRYATYIYTEALARSMGLPIAADTMFLKEAKSSRIGLAIVLGLDQDKYAEGKLTQDEWEEFGRMGEALLREIQIEYPEIHMDHWFMESCLCAYKGFFRNTRGRYLPYYLDRMADEISQMAVETATSGVDWRVLWQFREEQIIWEYLGEKATPKRLKVDKALEHVLRDTGHMVGLWVAQRRLIVPRTKVGA